MNSYIENYDDIPDQNFKLIPEGSYLVKVTDSIIGPSKASGQDTWYLSLEIISGEFTGRKLWFNTSMREEAKGVRKGITVALGINHKPVDIIKDVIDKEAIAIVFHDIWHGEKKEKVKRLKAIKEDSRKLARNPLNYAPEKVEEELDSSTPF